MRDMSSAVVRIPDLVAHVDGGAAVYLGRLPAGPALVLTGGAASVWRAVDDLGAARAGGAPVGAVVERLVRQDGASAEQVEAVLQELVDAALLLAADHDARPGSVGENA